LVVSSYERVCLTIYSLITAIVAAFPYRRRDREIKRGNDS
jgi:hypothetical protein